MTIDNEPEHFMHRYENRREAFHADVVVWRSPDVRARFADWDAFSRAANGERAQRPEDIRDAERFMQEAGFEEGPRDAVGARQWQVAKPTPWGRRSETLKHVDQPEPGQIA